MNRSLGMAGPGRRRNGGPRIVRLVVGSGGLLAVAALAAAPVQAAEPAVATAVDERPAEVREYWTNERMSSARPVERLVERIRDRVGGGGDADRGEPGVVSPARPNAGGRSALLEGVLGGEPQPQPAQVATQVANTSSYPSRTHGKVFFSIPGRGNFFCSGTVVRSPGQNVVLTAGHCVYDYGRWATNWMFVPGYHDGDERFGRWSAQTLATTPQWRESGALRYDVGIAVVRRNANGRGIQGRVGARGIAFNQPRNQFYRAFGYPARSPYNGQRLYRCDSPYRGDDRNMAGPRPMRIECDMTAGSSGGGWVVDGRFVSSVVSYAYECSGGFLFPCNNPEAGMLFGPYFGNQIRRLYRANRGRARICGGRPATHRGGGGDNTIRGTKRADVIHGGRGNDVLYGRAGNDTICGGAGSDRIFGGRGNNRIYTGAGHDIVRARARGSNRIWALRGRNRVICGPGHDRVVTNRLSRVHGSCDVVIRR